MEHTTKHRPAQAPLHTQRNRAASRLITLPFNEEILRETAKSARNELGGAATIGFLFATGDYHPYLPDLLEIIQVHGHIPCLVACSGWGVIGTRRESENLPAISLLLLRLPHTTLRVLELGPEPLPESPGDWYRKTGLPPHAVDFWIALANPYGFPVESWLKGWSRAYPNTPTIGGLCAARGDGDDQVFIAHNQSVLPNDRALLVGFRHGVRLHTVVSQGCRPIAEPCTITRAYGNTILTLGGRPAYTVLAEAFESLSPVDKIKAQGNLFAGLASNEYLEEFRQGDFLIRSILGADAVTGAVAVGGNPRVGQTLQWQLRDPLAARSDLAGQLHNVPRPLASLVFSCAGRGTELYGTPGHDANAIANIVGPAASAGIFCHGEIGPAGNGTFVHGNTISVGFLV